MGLSEVWRRREASREARQVDARKESEVVDDFLRTLLGLDTVVPEEVVGEAVEIDVPDPKFAALSLYRQLREDEGVFEVNIARKAVDESQWIVMTWDDQHNVTSTTKFSKRT